MRAAGFASFSQSVVTRLERGTRPLLFDEAIGLARELDVDLLGALASAVAGDPGHVAAIEEKIAYVHLLKMTEELAGIDQKRDELDRAAERIRADYAHAEAEWERARRVLQSYMQKGTES